MELPPPLPPDPPSLPPLLPPAPPTIAPPPFAEFRPPPPAPRQRLSAPWIGALAGVGLVQLLLALAAPAPIPGVGYKIGAVLGGTVFWPAVIGLLFAIGRRFRNLNSQSAIFLVVWLLASLGHLGNIATSGTHVSKPAPAATAAGHTTPSAVPALDLSRATLTAAPAPATVASEPALPASPYDLSPGSDQRLIKLIEHAQETSYHAVVDAYLKACVARPQDPVLALERVRFIERFAYAEDGTIESASADHDAAVADLNTRFPDAPGTILYNLSNTFGADFEAQAEAAAPLVARWCAEDRAQYFLRRAEAANHKDATVATRRFAEASFNAHPTADAGLIYAKALHAAKEPGRCLEVLVHPAFADAQPWIRREKMNLLFALGHNAEAIALFEELSGESAWLVTNQDTADLLARAGRVNLAREVLSKLKVGDFNREKVHRDRFAFELAHGTAEQADTAYRELRADGVQADPFARQRFALFGRHPGLAWTTADLGGASLFGAVLAGSFLLPLVLLVPVHYWSLLRARRGKIAGWSAARWGLRTAWWIFGTICVGEVFLLWFYQPDALPSWFIAGKEVTPDLEAIVPTELWIWGLASTLITILLLRARAWHLLGSGGWSFGRSLGLALGSVFVLRVLLAVYVLLWPGALAGELAASAPTVRQIMVALLAHLGPWGMITTVALLVPVLEEVLFRGLLLQSLARHIPFLWANVAQAVIFASLHQSLPLFPFFLAFGLVGGWFARRSGGLLPSMLFHGFNNLLVCIAFIVRSH